MANNQEKGEGNEKDCRDSCGGLCLAEQAEMMAGSELFEKSEDNQVQRTA